MPQESEPRQNIQGKYNAQASDGSTAIVNVYAAPTPREIDPKTLAVAKERLAALPTEKVPVPESLPPGSLMPFSPNPLFEGREKDLQHLAEILKQGRITVIGQTAVVTGQGGIGKSQLASEWVHRYGQYFAGGAYWLNFSDAADIANEVAQCGGPGRLDLRPDFSSLSPEEQVTEVLSAWQSPLPRLLVFDNCEDPDLLAYWRPPSGASRVLVTSRRSEWGAALGVQTLPLALFSRDESISLLRRHREGLSETAAEALAKELGDLPLALDLAGHFLSRYRHILAPESYLAQLRDAVLLSHPSLCGRGASHSPTKHDLHVGRTFALSLDRLDPDDPLDALALALLVRAAYFAPGEAIPRNLLLMTLQPSEEVSPDPLQTEDALLRLSELGLLKPEAEGALSQHRLIQYLSGKASVTPKPRMPLKHASWRRPIV